MLRNAPVGFESVGCGTFLEAVQAFMFCDINVDVVLAAYRERVWRGE